MPDLRKYRAKRDPRGTPEPLGDENAPLAARRPLPPTAARSFVVQQHAARRMHWDLRLEIDGVLVSWAVPRGPTLDPRERRLAVQTEDHPIEYAGFEGVIPEGNYGAGAMIVWDRGSYHSVDGQSPAEGLASGKLDLMFDGHKLRGRFALVRTKGTGDTGNQTSWLLLHKNRNARAVPEERELVVRADRSVLSGLTISEIRDGVTFGDEIAVRADGLGATKRRLDCRKLRPMLAATGDAAFSDAAWLFEVKYDGMRVLAARDLESGVKLYTRTGREVSRAYPEITRALEAIPLDDFVFDGEVAALDEHGHTSFERLQRRFSQTDATAIARAQIEVPTVLFAFDLLAAAGRDLRRLPLFARKQLLERIAPTLGQVRYADHVEEQGDALFAVAVEHDLEGVIAKRANSRYETGRRSKNWLKLRVPHSAVLAVVGWERGRGSRERLGSLKLAWWRGDDLVYAGNVGSGLDDATIDEILPQLEDARVDVPVYRQPHEGGEPPGRNPSGTHRARATRAKSRDARFSSPTMAARVRYTEVTSGGHLRHPTLLELIPFSEGLGLEHCVAPIERDEAIVATPASAPVPEAELQITRREKVFWPESGETKGDLLDYYDAIWPWISPYLRDRPVVLTRYPDGVDGKSFFQQNAPEWTPEWALRETIDGTDFFICNEKRTLLHVINSGAIPLHVWSARRGSISHPDWITLDLDPKAAPFSDVVKVARHIHALLDELAAPHFVKTSGQAGLHVLIPIGAVLDHADARALAEVLAKVVVQDLPDIATVARPIASRGDKVYIDYLQNGRGKLIVAPFSVRPRPGVPVSTPLTWRQVTSRLNPGRWNASTSLKQMTKQGDPMLGLLNEVADVDALLNRLVARG